jgi:hypothetical protein
MLIEHISKKYTTIDLDLRIDLSIYLLFINKKMFNQYLFVVTDNTVYFISYIIFFKQLLLKKEGFTLNIY